MPNPYRFTRKDDTICLTHRSGGLKLEHRLGPDEDVEKIMEAMREFLGRGE